ncbi:alpha/beta hydrolase-fold protein [Calidithermus chliarophilus]|uniref:alpha/beta hydrolase-fold protein n=1 Tax=Calidithermus chliarophilus TaxID=52023 RepID=UPI00041FD923|nr:alpha/beta hydrolase-fold protein [Calidithermus chliarophilus]
MFAKTIWSLILALLAGGAMAARVTLVVTQVPADTPPGAVLSLGANVNNWDPGAAGYKFTRDEKGVYRLEVDVPVGANLEFKVTLGSWATVEKNPFGQDIPNRVLNVLGDMSVEFKVARWASTTNVTAAPTASTLSGKIEVIANVASPQLGNARDLLIYLPPSYANSDKRYPVLYLQDGQNVFNASTSYSREEWGADEAAEALAKKGLEAILVGIPNMGTERLAEYAFFPHREAKWTARGEAYAAFLVNTVKPLIDGKYRTLPERVHTGIVGSSAGGSISLLTALRHPQVFGFVGAMSPAFWLNQPAIYPWVRENPNPALRVWIDMGSEEGPGMVMGAQWMADLLESQGNEVRLVLEPGGKHFEVDWRRRFPAVLEMFLTPPQARVAPEAAALLEKAAGAMNLKGVQTLRLKFTQTDYTYTQAGPQAATPVEGMLLFDFKGRRVRVEVLAGNQPIHVEQVTPEGGWVWDVRSGTEPMSLENALYAMRFLQIGAFGLTQGASGRDYARVLGPIQLLDQEGEGLEVVTEGRWANLLFSPEGMLLAERYAVPGGSPETLVFGDYRTVGGVRFSFEVKGYVDQTLFSRFKVAELEVNPAFGPQTFARP